MDFVVKNGVLTQYTGPGGEVFIPESVSIIGKRAFYNRLDVIRLFVPGSVLKIEAEAFYNCQGLTELGFSEGLQEIEEHAFYTCWRLMELVIPAGVKTLRKGAFENCQELTSVTFFEGLEELEGRAFGHCPHLEKIQLPDSVTKLHKTAFANCDALTDLRADGIALNDLSVKCRQAVMVDFARRLLAGEKIPSDRQMECLQYIRSNRKKLYPYALQHGDLLRFMLGEQLIPQKDIQPLLDEADRQGLTAAGAILLAYHP